MAERPATAVLSDQIKEAIAGRRLLSAVFVTFCFEPEFFEQQVLPLFFDVPLSHADAIKRIQMEDVLKDVPHGVTVYYDQSGLSADAKSARLDVRRVAVRHSTGIFHPKNIFALVEALEPDEEGHREQSLIVASLSANLTRAGWWENVEVCHIEELQEGDFTRLKNDVLDFLDGLERRVGQKASDGHAALRAIKAFVKSTDQRQKRTSYGGLHTHFYNGSVSVVDFLQTAAGSSLHELNLEIISPYFDIGPECAPLASLIDAFAPREVRVFLPKNESGEALCSPGLFAWVRSQPNVSWGRLPKDLTRGGKAENAKARTVHAKIYRFFSSQPKREFLFVGSVNLTNPAHASRGTRGGNLETGFLVELDPPRRPEWWMECDGTKPTTYEPRSEDEGAVSGGGSRLSLRYWWDADRAEAYWDDKKDSPYLAVSWQGGELFHVASMKKREWTVLPEAAAHALQQVLRSTSILSIQGDQSNPVPVLVQEEGMKAKPSALFDLSPSEILRYWSLLTAEQRAAFWEARAPEEAIAGDGSALVAKYARVVDVDTFFDRFAGIFISFGNLERSIRDSLATGNLRAADYRLFGQKYDSLGKLLDRVHQDSEKGDESLVEHYVMALCARQMVTELRRDNPDFFRDHAQDAKHLETQLDIAQVIRQRLAKAGDDSMGTFLEWFERWFLRRAETVEHEASA